MTLVEISVKKVLMMGKSRSGKTSMRFIIFNGLEAVNTRKLSSTEQWEVETIQFLPSLHIDIWDCGGQYDSIDKYSSDDVRILFKGVHVLIYVFDISSVEHDKDIHYYQNCLERILRYSPNAKVFCFINKIDLIPENMHKMLLGDQKKDLQLVSEPIKIEVFQTTIWNEILFTAWGKVINYLIPHIDNIKPQLEQLLESCEGNEIVLFEKSTFLALVNYSKLSFQDDTRFDKFSAIMKMFNSSKRLEGFPEHMEIRGTNAVFIETFTKNTVVVLIIPNPRASSAAIRLNIAAVRVHFERLKLI